MGSKQVIFLLLIFFSVVNTRCSVLAPEPTSQPTETMIPSSTPTPEPPTEPTLTATPTLTLTPTQTPTPISLNLVYNFQTIDPYDFYVKKQGRFMTAYEDFDLPAFSYWVRTPEIFDYFKPERGDNIMGNSKDGWKIIYKNRVIFLGPGLTSENGYTTFVVGVGEKNKKGKISINKTKTLSVTEGAIIVLLPNALLDSPRFYYDPISSSFIAELNTEFEKREGWPPEPHIVDIPIMIKYSQILFLADYANYPDWCLSEKRKMHLKIESNLTGYTINGGKLYYWGETIDGKARCPNAEVIETN